MVGAMTGIFKMKEPIPAKWALEPDLLLYGYWFWDWADSYERVASIDFSKEEITLAKPWHRYGYANGAHFYAYNAVSELDSPGEWYLDRKHALDGELFLQMMAGCRGVACTAGFESVCEAAYFGKPLLMVPIENHVTDG